MSPLLAFAILYWRAEPETRAEEAYKWLYHATLGGEHAVADDVGPRRWLDDEWATLAAPRRAEPEIVPLRPDGKIVRLNLRPYKARGGDKEMILALFVQSARRFHAEKSEFRTEWNALGALLKSKPIGKITESDWRRIDAETRPLGYPAIDHSPTYERTYHPAYRVILGEMLVR